MRVTEGDASVSHTAGSEVQCLSQGTLLRPSQTRLFPYQVSCKPLVSICSGTQGIKGGRQLQVSSSTASLWVMQQGQGAWIRGRAPRPLPSSPE